MGSFERLRALYWSRQPRPDVKHCLIQENSRAKTKHKYATLNRQGPAPLSRTPLYPENRILQY